MKTGVVGIGAVEGAAVPDGTGTTTTGASDTTTPGVSGVTGAFGMTPDWAGAPPVGRGACGLPADPEAVG